MHAYVLIALLSQARLSRCNSYIHYVMVHVWVGTPAVRKPLTAVKAATAPRSTTNPLPPLPKRRARFMPVTSTNKLHGSIPGVWQSFHIRHLVLPILLAAPPPTSSTTYPHGGCLHCPQRPPTSAPSCFSLYNHVRFSSGTHAVHLRVLSPPHRGRSGLHFHLSFLVFLTLLLLEVQERVVPRTSITVPFPYATWPSSGLTPSSGTPYTLFHTIRGLTTSSGTPYTCHIILHYKGPVLIFILTLYSLLFFATLIPSLPSLYHTHRTHNLCSTSA